MPICSVGFSMIRHLLSSQITVLNTNAILAQVLQLKTISNEVLICVKKFISFPINNMSSTQGFRNIIQLPLTFLNIQASLLFPMKNKLFWQFHHNENSNSIMLASVHHWISKACIYFSIL